jgi:hypothetical protein
MKVLSVILFFLFNGFLGLGNISEGLVKEYLFSKLPILKQFEIKNINYSLNNFSVTLKKGNNNITLIGNFYPFTATYSAKLNNLNQISKFRGKLFSEGVLKSKNGLFIKGSVVLANGVGEFKGTPKEIRFFLNDANLTRYLYTLGIDYNYLLAKINTAGKVKKTLFATYDFKGKLKYIVDIPLKAKGSYKYFDSHNFVVKIYFDSILGKGEILIKREKNLFFKGKIPVLNLLKIKKITHYPFGKMYDVSFTFNSMDNILNFDSKYISGYYDKNFFLQLKSQNANTFFEFLGIKPFIKGIVTGNIIVSKKGVFDLLIENAALLPSKIIKYIYKTSGVNLSMSQKMFLKGSFTDKKVNFNFLSKSPQFSLNIHNGVYNYNGNYQFKIELSHNKTIYYYLVRNGKIKLIKKRNLNVKAPETLVF